jgi:hypothetical protein
LRRGPLTSSGGKLEEIATGHRSGRSGGWSLGFSSGAIGHSVGHTEKRDSLHAGGVAGSVGEHVATGFFGAYCFP